MNRKEYKLLKREISRLLKKIDSSFLPDVHYSKASSLATDVSNLRYVVDLLYNDLTH